MGGAQTLGTGSIWNEETLRHWLATFYRDESVVVLANREPFRHERTPRGEVVVKRSSGGLVTALEPLIQAASGVWVARDTGTTASPTRALQAVADGPDGIDVPSAHRRYRLRRVRLNAAEERHYYDGFANEGLWPLCHRTTVAPIFRRRDFATYISVNARFVDAAIQEVRTNRPLVLVQDYHFALAPEMLRRHLPLASIVTFWHIPWPTPTAFAACPWGRQLLQGLLGSSIVGFQTPEDCHNFMSAVEESLDAHVNREGGVIDYAGHHTLIRDYPVSIKWPTHLVRQLPTIAICRATVRRRLGLKEDIQLGVGIDRLDYTKGINEKVLAIERLLEVYPPLREQFVFVQIAEPSRECLPAYRACRAQLRATAARINNRFRRGPYEPIVFLNTSYEPLDVYRLLRAADVCYVGSLHDGMNLVAKEFVAARDDEHGVLLLSRFTGAARELTRALLVDPRAIMNCALTLARGLGMSGTEQGTRMRQMRAIVAARNTYRWAGTMLADATQLRAREATNPRPRSPWLHVRTPSLALR